MATLYALVIYKDRMKAYTLSTIFKPSPIAFFIFINHTLHADLRLINLFDKTEREG